MTKQIIDYIGYHGPIILFAMTFYSLINRSPFLIVFVLGSITNTLFNAILKSVLREPRPNNQIEFVDSHNLIGYNNYGLPSGHAQSVFFSLTFLFLANGEILFLYVMSCITILTLYQRWKYRRHTIKQLLIGSAVGIVYAWVLVYFTKSYLHGDKLFRI